MSTVYIGSQLETLIENVILLRDQLRTIAEATGGLYVFVKATEFQNLLVDLDFKLEQVAAILEGALKIAEKIEQ